MAAVLLILLLGVGLAAALVWLARTLRELRADWSTQLSDRNAEVDRLYADGASWLAGRPLSR